MSSYRGLAAFTPGVPPGGDSTQYTFGLSFTVTQPGCQLDGWWWYCDVANSQQTNAEDFALWTSTGATSGIYVASSKVTSGTFVQGWNFVACATPIPLTSGQEYRAVKTTAKTVASATTYCHTAHFFESGAGGAGVVNGPLMIFAGPTGSANTEPSGDGQMTFYPGGTDVTLNYPANQFNASWYGMDVQVSVPSGIMPLQLIPPIYQQRIRW